jgi:AAA+ superfamily predicted ATPase
MDSDDWTKKNQDYLTDRMNKIEVMLREYITDLNRRYNENIAEDIPEGTLLLDVQHTEHNWKEKGFSSLSPPAIETISRLFGLSDFERSILLLCAGVELKGEISDLCGKANGNLNLCYATFGLAFAALPNPHWTAITPISPLRRLRLVTVLDHTDLPIVRCPIKIDEGILHYLLGISYHDRQLWGLMIRPVEINSFSLTSSQQQFGGMILNAYSKKEEEERVASNQTRTNEVSSSSFTRGRRLVDDMPSVNLWGPDEFSKKNIAKWVCEKLGLRLWQIDAESIPLKPEEIDAFSAICYRDALLLGYGLYISAQGITEPVLKKTITKLVESNLLPGPLFLSTDESWLLSSDPLHVISFGISKHLKSEQLKIWRDCIELEGLPSDIISDADLTKLAGNFDFTTQDIISAIKETSLITKGDKNDLFLSPSSPPHHRSSSSSSSSSPSSSFTSNLWQSSRKVAQSRLSKLAKTISPAATLQDIVLPTKQKQLLKTIILHQKNRIKVYSDWGFGAKGSRGLGTTALFVGESGTGKTMAAEALANELKLDLFKIDLSKVVSKYIGETEKNLDRHFEAAEIGGSILFLDEADTLFGKRTEVRDSHDRYANIEVGYLLQRMEEFSGLAILATNMETALDDAFIRRIRFIVKFPFPDEISRAEIWRNIFPKDTPTKNLNIESLAKLNITGGNIRNIALNAAFLAAEEGTKISMRHLKESAQIEFEKLERSLPQAELNRW